MRVLVRFILLLVAVLIAGGAVFLASWEIPAPVQRVEKVISNDRFAR